MKRRCVAYCEDGEPGLVMGLVECDTNAPHIHVGSAAEYDPERQVLVFVGETRKFKGRHDPVIEHV